MSSPTPSHLEFDLSGLAVRLSLGDAQLAEQLRQRWRNFRSPRPAKAPLLDVDVRRQSAGAPAPVLAAEEAVRFETRGGTIDVHPSGKAEACLSAGTPEDGYYALVNVLSAALAWRLPAVGGALVHGAAVVIDGRAFALVGASGSGKTTWATLARSAGAIFLSDEMAFIDGAGARVEALSVPIRGNHPEPHGPGRWPLAAWLFPAHGAEARLDPMPSLLATASLAANLPFVSGLLEKDGPLASVLESLLSSAPSYRLTFARDTSFMEPLRRLRR
jgi:hypothetical protein